MSGAHDPYPTVPNGIDVDQIHVSPASPVSPARGDSEHQTVLRRLSTMFSNDAGDSGFSTFSGLSRTASAPPPPVKDRNAIKVLVVTWNMGDALPKGDLSVLLGQVPKYEPKPGEGLPIFDVAEGHPYHVVVVAAQECPTPSGMPRGLGGTLMKGVGLQKSEAYKREKEERDKEKDKEEKQARKEARKEEKREEKAARKEAAKGGEKEDKTEREDKGEKSESTDCSDEEDAVSPAAAETPNGKPINGSIKQDRINLPRISTEVTGATEESGSSVRRRLTESGGSYTPSETSGRRVPSMSGSPAVPHGALNVQKVGPRGWSAMLDDWLCNGPPEKRNNAMSPPLPSTAAFERSEVPSRTSSPATVKPPPIPTTATKPLAIPGSSSGLQPPSVPTPHGRSPLGLSIESNPFVPASVEMPPLVRSSSDRVLARPIFDDYKPCREPGTGPYVNVAKERLLGLYTSVFVYRGCEHLVEGVDKDFVTAGLAGGRIGNKGGIGISLNLAGHRMLFVNAHLAAHTERQDARLANIAKIKQELNLDCFLPPDDPRATMEDITDRFDTTFWCGDLNFRVDISIIHARWLLEQKKYQDALMFDQLKKAMANPKTNPLPGFREADITFMPTFKYDVWKSVRATNRELRRSIRQRRRTMEKQDRPSLDERGTPGTGLEFVPEMEGVEEHAVESSEPPDSPEYRARQRTLGSPELPELPLDDWRSEISSVPGDGRSFLDNDGDKSFGNGDRSFGNGERSGRSTSHSRSASAPRSPSTHRSPSIPRSSTDWSRPSRDVSRQSMDTLVRPVHSLKQKTKKLMGILSLGKRPIPRPRNGSAKDDDEGSRRLSLTSVRSDMTGASAMTASQDDCGPQAIAVPGAPPVRADRVEDTPDDLADDKLGSRHLSMSSSRGLSPSLRPRPSIRRSPSGTSLREEEFDDDFDDTVDHRVGVYDTSKKARVPSWCDRVLWKSHIIPEEDDDLGLTRVESRAPLSRLSHALSNFGGHFRRRSTTFNMDPVPQGQAVPSTPPTRPTSHYASSPGRNEGIAPDELDPVFDSEPATPVTESPEQEKGLVPTPEDPPSPEHAASSPTTPKRMRERSVTFHGAAGDSSPDSFMRRRATSVGIDTSPRRDSLRRRASISLARRSSGTLRRRSADPTCSPSASSSALALKPVKTTGHSLEDTRRRNNSISHDTLGSAIGRFLRDLPGRFHSRVNLFQGENEEPHQHDSGVRRHLAGEVEVLHYGTIDDAGMRQLEGRSDHRPAIFAAAVYV